jgi:hypothetical protein
MPLDRHKEWTAVTNTLCYLAGVHVHQGQLFLLASHIRQQAEEIVHLVTRVRPLLKYDEWNDNHSLRIIDLRAASTASFAAGTTLKQRATAALAPNSS